VAREALQTCVAVVTRYARPYVDTVEGTIGYPFVHRVGATYVPVDVGRFGASSGHKYVRSFVAGTVSLHVVPNRIPLRTPPRTPKTYRDSLSDSGKWTYRDSLHDSYHDSYTKPQLEGFDGVSC